jgi:hypothetical protein
MWGGVGFCFCACREYRVSASLDALLVIDLTELSRGEMDGVQ